jgi:hypothetical protein
MSFKERLTKPGDVQNLKGVLFGPPKTGKTTAACSGKNTLLVEFEPDGDLTQTLKGRDDIDVYKPQNWKDCDELLQALHTTDRGTYDFIAFDSVTWLTEVVAGRSILKTYQENTDPRRAYGKVGAAVNQIIKDAVALPNHVIFTAQLRVESLEEGTPMNPEEGEHPVTLAVTPMVFKVLSPAVSFMGRTYKKPKLETVDGQRNRTTGYFVSFDDSGRSPAGSRIELPPVVENLDLNNLLGG